MRRSHSFPATDEILFRRHPLLLDAILWAIPAILFGAGLRLMLLHYSPYAYWGSD